MYPIYQSAEVKSAILRDPLVISPDAPVAAAIAQMSTARSGCGDSHAQGWQSEKLYLEARSSCIVVVEDRQVVGILTERDITRLIFQNFSLDCPVRQVMTQPVVILPESTLTDVFVTLHLLEHHGICHLPVVDEQNCLVGLITQIALLHLLNPLNLHTLVQQLETKVLCLEVEQAIQLREELHDRKQAEAKLQESEALLRLFVQYAPVGIIMLDRSMRCVMASQRWIDEYQLGSLSSILGRSHYDLVPETSEQWRQIHQRCLAGAIETCDEDLLIRADGTQQWLRWEVHPWFTGTHEIGGIIIFTEDIGQRKQLELSQQELNQSLERKVTERTDALHTSEAQIRQQIERETLLREITQRIRQSLDLQTIFETACHEIRQVVQADRVAIFKFRPDSHFDDGEFVAESVVEGFSPVVTIQVHDHCFGKNYSNFYAKGRFQAVDDIYASGLQPCHSNILAQFQVRANLIMPLLSGEQLWGLLCIHQCAAPRHWQPSEIELTQQLASQLAIAIQQASLYDQIQSELMVRQRAEAEIALQLRRQQALGAIVQRIRESLDLNEILATVVRQVKDVMQGDRVIIFRLFPDGCSQIVEEAVSDGLVPLKNRHWDNETWSQDILDCYWQGIPRIVPDVMNDIWTNCLIDYSTEGQIQSKIVAPILQDIRSGENHRWVAPWETNKLWGILVVHACREKRVWHDSEAQLLQHIANQLAVAIQQAGLFEQLQQELTERQQAQQQLTERNQQLAVSNEELARATRLKDEFLANMSHELRTPLNAILGMTEGLQESVFGDVNPQQAQALETLERSASHLLELINDILDVAKIESGQLELDCFPTAIAPLCKSSLAFIKQQALKKHIHLEIKLAPNLPELLIDERRIRQVLINLLTNAVKFTPEKGRIILEANYQPGSMAADDANSFSQNLLHIAVTDTGIGIAPNHLNKLFQPFVQIDSALNRKYEGTGLGLALVKRLVELHGGRVSVTSEVGSGSCFAITLPCEVSTTFPKSEIQPGTTVESSQINQPKSSLILLAEDNEGNINSISSYLKAKDYRVLLAKNGQEAIAVAQSENPDLILMDIQMPGIDGLEAMRQIRCHPNSANIPIIALTALAMKNDRDRCLDAGANDYLTKPVKLKHLTTVIQTLLALNEPATQSNQSDL
ncbi:GAF domain-containing protein [Oscillatoria sp. FACHB-1407]|uniref:GAF domain-containing protein n=1 Tax=Oscillatoria sp. FACHB-1407 TaxID=2692847 RepID=UPI0016849463|nr:GAF domain-containing protein [Oscillatoria sp. FACHB-1407]MBD2459517.1 GAF domain-containing protein [Oscillatoria sp. FACHB-1407]